MRFCQEHDEFFSRKSWFQLSQQRIRIWNKSLHHQLLLSGSQCLFQRFTRHLYKAGTICRHNTSVIDLHIQTVFSPSIHNKNQIVSGEPCLELKMSMVGNIGIIQIFQAVQTILHCMIGNVFIIQIIPYRVAVAKDINILIGCKINGHIRFFALCQRLGKDHAVYHMFENVAVILTILGKLWKEFFPFLIKCHNLTKNTSLAQSLFQISKICRNTAQGNISLLIGCILSLQLHLFQNRDIYMIKCVTHINS